MTRQCTATYGTALHSRMQLFRDAGRARTQQICEHHCRLCSGSGGRIFFYSLYNFWGTRSAKHALRPRISRAARFRAHAAPRLSYCDTRSLLRYRRRINTEVPSFKRDAFAHNPTNGTSANCGQVLSHHRRGQRCRSILRSRRWMHSI